jgi:hypothetical protein
VVVYMGTTTNVMVEILFIYWLYNRLGGRFSVGFSQPGNWLARRMDEERDPHANRNAVGSGLRPGGPATSRVSHSSSFMVSSDRGGA